MQESAAIEIIEQRIFLVRGKKVMLSHHLAEFYAVETKVLMQAVRRNMFRFPEDFMFRLFRAGVQPFEVTNCDLKARWTQVYSLCFYRTRDRHALERIEKPQGH